MYHVTPLYTQTTFKVSNSSLGIGLIPKEDSDYCKTTNRSFIYYSLFHPALEAGTRPLKSFTVYPNTHIFGLWSRLSTRVGGAGGGGGWYSAKFFTGESAQRLCDYRRRNEEWRPSTIFKDVLFDDSRWLRDQGLRSLTYHTIHQDDIYVERGY